MQFQQGLNSMFCKLDDLSVHFYSRKADRWNENIVSVSKQDAASAQSYFCWNKKRHGNDLLSCLQHKILNWSPPAALQQSSEQPRKLHLYDPGHNESLPTVILSSSIYRTQAGSRWDVSLLWAERFQAAEKLTGILKSTDVELKYLAN